MIKVLAAILLTFQFTSVYASIGDINDANLSATSTTEQISAAVDTASADGTEMVEIYNALRAAGVPILTALRVTISASDLSADTYQSLVDAATLDAANDVNISAADVVATADDAVSEGFSVALGSDGVAVVIAPTSPS